MIPSVEKLTDHLMVLKTYQQMRIATADFQDGRTDVFEFEGVLFTCFYEPKVLKDRFCIQCEVLELVDQQDAKWLSLMLKDNWRRCQNHLPVFVLDIRAGRLQTLWNVPLVEQSPAAFDRQIRAWVHDVKQWKLQFLLDQGASTSSLSKRSRFPLGGQIA